MKVDESVANLDICGRFCGSCPTYKENSLKTGQPTMLFCARGKSDKASEEKMMGCGCPGCGVYKRYKLTGDYFCKKYYLFFCPRLLKEDWSITIRDCSHQPCSIKASHKPELPYGG